MCGVQCGASPPLSLLRLRTEYLQLQDFIDDYMRAHVLRWREKVPTIFTSPHATWLGWVGLHAYMLAVLMSRVVSQDESDFILTSPTFIICINGMIFAMEGIGDALVKVWMGLRTLSGCTHTTTI